MPERNLAEDIIGLHYAVDMDHRFFTQAPLMKSWLNRLF